MFWDTYTWAPFQKEGFQSSEFEPERRVAKICNVQLVGFRTHVNSWFNELWAKKLYQWIAVNVIHYGNK